MNKSPCLGLCKVGYRAHSQRPGDIPGEKGAAARRAAGTCLRHPQLNGDWGPGRPTCSSPLTVIPVKTKPSLKMLSLPSLPSPAVANLRCKLSVHHLSPRRWEQTRQILPSESPPSSPACPDLVGRGRALPSSAVTPHLCDGQPRVTPTLWWEPTSLHGTAPGSW